MHSAFCRSELAREKRQHTALNQATGVIVDDFREQARSYSEYFLNVSRFPHLA
ncbi:hypothetical protein PFL603g_04438 [Pseudomonas fluorescens]|jgi:hypothetical protein|uniref:Uncharacterized protein n=1 Tax=Pseudomonas fluorescens TaxID=294 RepID=A0A109KMH2_PSEFL|nr:hypothetical protein PFL603g_04438 [Pseudomonas fluorescens]